MRRALYPIAQSAADATVVGASSRCDDEVGTKVLPRGRLARASDEGGRARDDEPTALLSVGPQDANMSPRESARVVARRPSPRPSHAPSTSPGAYRQTFPPPSGDEVGESVERPRVSLEPQSEPPLELGGADLADYHFRAAEVLLARGYAREAVFEAQKAMRLSTPSAAQRVLYAWALYGRGGLTPSVDACIEDHLGRALQEDPACDSAHALWALMVHRH